MARAVASHNPELLSYTFISTSFSPEKGGPFQAKLNWEQELYKIVREEGAIQRRF